MYLIIFIFHYRGRKSDTKDNKEDSSKSESKSTEDAIISYFNLVY